jgi:hypothetical protein
MSNVRRRCRCRRDRASVRKPNRSAGCCTDRPDALRCSSVTEARVVFQLTWLFTPFLITVSLVEATFLIDFAFMALFVFATPGK